MLSFNTTYQVHEQARTLNLTIIVDPLHQHGTKFLAQKITAYQEHISMPAKTNISKNPHGYNKGHRYMNSKEPLGGKPFYISSPVPEGDIQQEHEDGDEN